MSLSSTQKTVQSLLNQRCKPGTRGDVRFNCFSCGETKQKLYVSRDGKYYCQHCSIHGKSVIDLVCDLYHCSTREAQEVLRDGNYELNSDIMVTKDLLMDKLVSLEQSKKVVPVHYTMPPVPSNVHPLMANYSNPEAIPFFNYLKGRGVSLKQIDENVISYVTEGVAVTSTDTTIRLENSLVFFTFNDYHVPLYWNTRSIERNPYIKTFNASGSETEYSKKNVVFNLNDRVVDKKLVICEGVFNALTIDQVEGYSGVATYGKQITDTQVHLIAEYIDRVKEIVIFLDDDADEEATKLYYRLKSSGVPDTKLTIVYKEKDGEDINDLGVSGSLSLLENRQPLTMYNQIRNKLLLA